MEKTLIIYSLSGKKDPLQITRKIYGYCDSSNHGKYKYERKGILSGIKYEKIARTVIWINPKDKERVLNQMKKLELKLRVFDIIVKK